jgi:hypothetical protein
MRPENNNPQQPHTIDWTIFFQWVLATTLGWIIGLALGEELGIGTTIGIAQWLVLRPLVSRAGWWIAATTVGWTVGWAIIVTGIIVPPNSGVLGSVIAGMFTGFIIGAAQWVVLRWWVRYSGWWIVTSIFGWSIGLTGILGGSIVGAVVGAVTGFALDFLLRYPHQVESTEP